MPDTLVGGRDEPFDDGVRQFTLLLAKSRLDKKPSHPKCLRVLRHVSRNPHRGCGELAYDRRRRPWIGETVTTYSGGSPSSVHTTDFAYDGDQIALQFDKNMAGSVTATDLSHRYLSGPAVDRVLADERVTVQNGTLATGEVLYPLADAQGTVQDVAKLNDTTTAVVDHINYSSFGGVVSESDSSQGCLFKYAGRPTDTATGLENNRARIYSAALHRFLSEDPRYLTAGDTNVYRYCGDDPVNATDPSGLADAPLPVVVEPPPTQFQGATGDQDAYNYVHKVVEEVKRTSPDAIGLPTLSEEFAREHSGNMPGDVWNGKAPYRPSSEVLVSHLSNLGDLVSNGPITQRVAVLELGGHASHTESIHFGDKGSGTTAFLDTPLYEYVLDRSTLAEFVKRFKAIFPQDKKPALIVLLSCNLGNFTRMDNEKTGTSLVQALANETGVPVLSPGGFVEGQSFFSGPPPTVTKNYLGKSFIANFGDNTVPGMENQKVNRLAYESQNHKWYLTTPRITFRTEPLRIG